MKVKIFALVAAFFMLMGGSAWAQSDVKGDVNKDGVVNEQDIAAILAIMAKNNGVAEKTKYYWYVGKDNPANLEESFNPAGVDGWTEFTKEKDSPIATNKKNADGSTNIWYIAAPLDWGYTLYNATGAASNEAGFNISTVTIGSVKYKVWASKAANRQVVGQLIIK